MLMKQKSFLGLLLLLTLNMAANPPNIIYILVDDWGYQDVGFRGSDILTPNMDQLAKDGVILDNHYVTPLCAPTRATLLTGRYPIRTGFWNGNQARNVQWGLPLMKRPWRKCCLEKVTRATLSENGILAS